MVGASRNRLSASSESLPDMSASRRSSLTIASSARSSNIPSDSLCSHSTLPALTYSSGRTKSASIFADGQGVQARPAVWVDLNPEASCIIAGERPGEVHRSQSGGRLGLRGVFIVQEYAARQGRDHQQH